MSKINIDFVITSIGSGGAQTMLFKLNSVLDRSLFSPRVISLTDNGEASDLLAERFRNIDVPVVCLAMPHGVPGPHWLMKLSGVIASGRPTLVSTWLYHADLMGGVAARFRGNFPIVWNLRNSNLEPHSSKRSTILVAKLCARLSYRLPNKIISCSKAAAQIHVQMGYDPVKMIIIPNGFDLSAFRPDPEAKRRFRLLHNIPETTVVIGYVARFDKQKDHGTFLRAAARLMNCHPEVLFVLCGDGLTESNRELQRWIDEEQLASAVRLLGRRADMPAVTAAFDIATSASAYGEAFSNAIGEAMACEIPCVVTDVGDSAMIVDDTGYVVPARDPQALAAGWHSLIELGNYGRAVLGRRARARVQSEFSLDCIARKYENLYATIVN